MIAFRSGYSLPHSRFRFARSSSLQGICRHVLTSFLIVLCYKETNTNVTRKFF